MSEGQPPTPPAPPAAPAPPGSVPAPAPASPAPPAAAPPEPTTPEPVPAPAVPVAPLATEAPRRFGCQRCNGHCRSRNWLRSCRLRRSSSRRSWRCGCRGRNAAGRRGCGRWCRRCWRLALAHVFLCWLICCRLGGSQIVKIQSQQGRIHPWIPRRPCRNLRVINTVQPYCRPNFQRT